MPVPRQRSVIARSADRKKLAFLLECAQVQDWMLQAFDAVLVGSRLPVGAAPETLQVPGRGQHESKRQR